MRDILDFDEWRQIVLLTLRRPICSAVCRSIWSGGDVRVCILSHNRGEMAHQFQRYREDELNIVIFGKGIPGPLDSVPERNVHCWLLLFWHSFQLRLPKIFVWQAVRCRLRGRRLKPPRARSYQCKSCMCTDIRLFWRLPFLLTYQPFTIKPQHISAPSGTYYPNCLDADQGAREQGKADEKLKWARYFNFGSVANENREVSFQPCFLICIGLNSIPAIKLESTFWFALDWIASPRSN